MTTNINKKQYIKDFNDMMNGQFYLDAISILIQAKDQNKDFSTTKLLLKIYDILLDAKLDNSLGVVSAHWMKNLLIEYSDNKDFITNERILETCKKIKKSQLSTSLKNMNIEQLQKYML